MAVLRALLLASILIVSFAIGAPLQWVIARFAPRSPAAHGIPLAFCRSLLFALNVRLVVSGRRETVRPVLIVANHVSWIDILALGAITPFCFLAKSEVASWPILSAFAEVQGTVFVDRRRRRSIPAANRDMAQRLDAGRPVLLFPEATTIDSPPLGRFYSSHFAAARDLLALRPDARPVVQPVAIAYSSRAAAWVDDDNLLSHLWSTLCSEPLTCRIAFGAPIPCGTKTNRKVLAKMARESIIVLNETHASQVSAAGKINPDEIVQPATTGGVMSQRRSGAFKILGLRRSSDGGNEATQADGDLAVIEKILTALPDAVIVIGRNDRIIHVNQPALTLLPTLRAGEPLAAHLRSPDILDAIALARRTGGVEQTSWLERVPVERLFEVSAAPIGGLDCGTIMIVTLHEISETRRFERMRVDFIANASHELRTPLASLLGFIETMQGPARNDEKVQGRFLAIMREQAQRMARLVDDLLSLTRIEQHQHLRPNEAIDLSTVIRHIADTLSPLAHDNGVELKLDLDEPLIVAGDRDELMRVAENLIENAIKYGTSNAENQTVQIEARKEGIEATITVRDHGEGIAPEHLPRLTERFYRVDAGQSRAKGGTGLGLAIVKHILARHRGRLQIESTRGEGSVFKIFLPLQKAERRG